MAHMRWKGLQYYELIACITRQDAFNALLRCLIALSGMGARPVLSVAVPSRFDTRLGQRCMRRHVGRQAAEVARWWSLHEDLHAATQVRAELAWKLLLGNVAENKKISFSPKCHGCVFFCSVFLGFRASYGGCVVQKSRIPLQYAMGLLL